MERLRVALLPALLLLVLSCPPPAGAQTCNCGLTGPWEAGADGPGSSPTGGYGVAVTTLPDLSTQITVTGPNGILLQQTYTAAEYYFINDNWLVINWYAGSWTSDLYSLTPTAATVIKSEAIPRSDWGFRHSVSGRFIAYADVSSYWHILRPDSLNTDYYVFGPSNGPIWGPADRILYYEDANGLNFINMPQKAAVLLGAQQVVLPDGVEFTPCGDAFGLIRNEAGADHVEMYDIEPAGISGSVTFPTGVSPTFYTSGTEHYGEWIDGGGVHDLHIANNTATQACPSPPPQPTTLSTSPSHGVGGGTFTVSVGLDKPIGFDLAGIGFLTLQQDSPAGGPGSMGGSWGAATATALLATVPVYGVPDTIHIRVAGTLQSASGIYVIDPTPPGLTLIYDDSSVLGGGGSEYVYAALDHPAPPGGATVTLHSSNPALLPVPASIVVPQGQQSWGVSVTAAAVLNDQTVTVTGTYNGGQKQATITIQGPHPWNLSTDDNCLVGGQWIHVALDVTQALTPSGCDIVVTSSDTAHVHAATIHFARGVFDRRVDLATSPVSGPTAVTVSATFNGSPVQFGITLQPPQSFTTNLIPSVNSAIAINDGGEVVGQTGGGIPFLWNDGVMAGAANPSGWNFGEANAVSSNGLVVGDWDGHAFSWDGQNAPVDLGAGAAYGVNAAGHIAGQLSTSHAFYYDGAIHDLGTLPGGTSSEARGINGSDVVVGRSNAADGHQHAYRWTSGGGMQVLAMPTGATDSWAYAINALGVIVGQAGTLGTYYACLWDGTGAHYLDSNSGSIAYALNDANQVVGLSQFRPVMWSGGTSTFLDALVGACGWNAYVKPTGINNHAVIVGTYNDGDSNPFGWLLTLGGLGPPADVPPPAETVRTLALAVLGANPVRGAVSLRCSLPHLGPATLDLVDVSGRRIASRALPGDGAVQFVRFDETASLAPGIYFARLTQGPHTKLTRVAVLR